VLDDPASTVRRAAARLLAGLPGSRLGQRMAAGAQALITLRRTRRRTKQQTTSVKLEVTLPAEFGPAWLRDGVDPLPPTGLGGRAWWLQQILAATPLDTWTAPVDAIPEELIGAARSSEWAELLLEGWAQAAASQRQPAWARALLLDGPTRLAQKSAQAVWQGLLPDEQEALVLFSLQVQPNQLTSQTQRWLLSALRRPWGQPLSALVIEQLKIFLSGANDQVDWKEHHHWLGELAYWLHPALLPLNRRPLEAAVSSPSPWASWLRQFLQTWNFRVAMLRELKP
jgi:hypothetical protein